MHLQEKHEASPMDRTAGDEGVGTGEQLVRVPFNSGAMTSCALRRLQEPAVHLQEKHEASPMDRTAGDEGVGTGERPSECHSTEPFSTTFGKRADRWGGSRDGSRRGRRRQSGG